jgi:nucleoid DNA-binding protein
MVYKEEFITRIAKENDFTKESTRLFYDAFIDVLGKYLLEGQEVQFTGFGAFKMKSYRYNSTSDRVIRPAFEISRHFYRKAEGEKSNEDE